MRRPRTLWVAVGLFSVLFCTFLGFWLWAEFGFERTVIIYETAEAPVVRSMAPGAAAAEEAGPTPTAESPEWLVPVRWGTMAAAAVVAAYVIYLEAMHRRRQRGERVRHR